MRALELEIGLEVFELIICDERLLVYVPLGAALEIQLLLLQQAQSLRRDSAHRTNEKWPCSLSVPRWNIPRLMAHDYRAGTG